MPNKLYSDLERMLSWKIPYILVNPRAREWIRKLKEVDDINVKTVCDAILQAETDEPELIVVQKSIEKLMRAEKHETKRIP